MDHATKNIGGIVSENEIIYFGNGVHTFIDTNYSIL